MKKTLTLLLLAALPLLGFAQKPKGTFEAGDKTFLLNGQPFVVKAAELHYPRIPRAYWEHRIKMCKALGMNTICLYVFWNIHEQKEGQFDFTGNNDVAAFCRLAQKNGMYIIVRPGPYVCAEWEMGGLPWWLLKKKDIRLREDDPYFLERVEIFEKEVGKQLAPLTIQNGGPIIMVQVENEYGSYGTNKPYVAKVRDIVRKSGFDKVALFQCDWSSNFTNNGLDDLIWTMNFGTGANIDNQFRRLKELRPNSPLMCSEFWSGWFDKWGARHETRNAKDMVAGLDEMLSKGISFSLYMTHGGTSFGHWAGANSPGFAPDVTSYDYDAPINEYGQATPKFHQLREMMTKYNDGKKLAPIPAMPAPIISIPKFELKEFSSILNGLDPALAVAAPKQGGIMTFEEMDMGWGSMLYVTQLPAIAAPSVLNAEVHDFAQVFINGRYIGKIDRVKNEKTLTLPAVKEGDELAILVEGMGRINFGRAIKDFKGIIGDVTLQTTIGQTEITLKPQAWTNVALPDSYAKATDAFRRNNGQSRPGENILSKLDANDLTTKPGYYRGTFNLTKTGDTFLNFETWGKGQVFINGHAIGRFWRIGPQQTLYVPGSWLKKGQNEIIVLDVVGPQQAVVWGQDKPELDKLQLEKSNKHNNPGDRPDLNSATPAYAGSFATGNGWQTVKFAQNAKGRLLCIEVLSNHNNAQPTAVAEIYALDASGKRISRDSWSTRYADSEEENGNHTGDKAFDLQESTYWQIVRGSDFPHLLVIDLGAEQTVSGLEYIPRAEQGAPGSVKEFKVYLQ
jgi:beta-galactosidase